MFVVPGGTVEGNENSEQTGIRELKEEASIDVKLDKLLWKFDDGISNCYYYLATNYKGEVKLCGEEATKNCPENQYILEWISIFYLDKIILYPVEIHKRIIDY